MQIQESSLRSLEENAKETRPLLGSRKLAISIHSNSLKDKMNAMEVNSLKLAWF
jgi:hypothetical protein